MISIGEFSRLCMVTAKTLRHYDAIGLLMPAFQNEQTGYRYYHASQLSDMLVIQRFKQYGFSLDEISELLHASPDTQAKAMDGKLLQLRQEHALQGKVLSQMEHDVSLLMKGKSIMEQKMDVKIVERQPVDIISIWESIAIKDFGTLFGTLEQKVQQTGAQLSGAPIALYHSPEFNPDKTEVELAYPTTTKSAVTRTLPGGTCAMAVHKGAYQSLHESYMAIGQWIDQNGYRVVSAPYEIYVNDPADTAENDLITEIYFPVAK